MAIRGIERFGSWLARLDRTPTRYDRTMTTAVTIKQSDNGELDRFGADPAQIVGDLDRNSMATSGKFGIVDGNTRGSRPCMCKYSPGDVYAERTVSDTEAIHNDCGIAGGLKGDADSDWRPYRPCCVWLLNPDYWST